MINRVFFSISLLFIFSFSQAQFDTSFIKRNIRHCADSLTHGFKTKDWDLFTRYSYPAMVGSLGGKKEFSTYISQMFSQVPDTAWKKYEPGKVLQVIKTGGDFQAIIELNTIIEWQGSRITTTSHLVAESWDGGMFWTFFDSQGDVNTAKLIKPDLHEQLIIPQREEKKERL
ncbi:MAG: hypothetical protein H7Y01_15025 [Ferruginibacter sp.]|nr:hypothetical protein [Chitinophagaceae bacterium]